MMFNPARLVCLATLLVGGCGADQATYPAKFEVAAAAQEAPPLVPAGDAAPQFGPADAAPQVAPMQRKIVRTAELNLAVNDLPSASASVMRLAAQVKGYVANSNVQGTAGDSRQGTWTIRIPVDAYDNFLRGVEQLGEVRSVATDSQDVTAEFFDLEARLRNKQQEEARLLKHLEQSTGKLDEILNVERELSRVREEIERMQGRRNLLQDVTSMTTVTVHLTEMRTFAPAVADTFPGRIAQTFTRSFKLLCSTATALLMISVALSPWLAVLAIALICVWFVRRIFYRQLTPLNRAAR